MRDWLRRRTAGVPAGSDEENEPKAAIDRAAPPFARRGRSGDLESAHKNAVRQPALRLRRRRHRALRTEPDDSMRSPAPAPQTHAIKSGRDCRTQYVGKRRRRRPVAIDCQVGKRRRWRPVPIESKIREGRWRRPIAIECQIGKRRRWCTIAVETGIREGRRRRPIPVQRKIGKGRRWRSIPIK